MKKRILAFILCICMMLELIPSSVYAAENGESTVVPVKETVSGGDVSSNDVTGGDENGTHKEQQVYGDTSGGDDVSGNDPVEVTRIEWLHQLTQTFEMKVEEDNYPDNYFSDVDSSSKYYYDLMLATEFGLVDVEAGDPFEPDKAATREFAAHTLNHCLGFQLDEENYTFTEADSVTYPNDIQAIINQGWLSLSDGAFLPNKGITADEEAFLLAQAKEVYNSTKIDPNHVNTWEYTDDVIALPEGTKAEYTSDTEITIYNCPAELKAGDKFGIVEQGLPIVKKVSKVVSSGEDYVIEVEDVSAEEAFKNIDVQGSLNADITDFEAADGVQISYIVGGSLENKWEDGTEYETLGEVGNQEVSAISLTTECDIPQEVKTKYDLPNDFKLEVSYKLSDLNPQYGHDKNGAFFKMNATAILNCNVSTEVKEDLIKDPNIKKSLILGEWTILLVGKVKCSLDLELSGKITFTLTERITLGVQASIFHGFRTICSFEKECFTIEAKVTAFIGLKFSVEFNVIALTGKIYATVGAEANATITAYDDGEAPATCADISAYLVATIGASATLELWLYKDSWDEKKGIYDETNSPVRIHLHWDDGTPVSECYRDREITEDPDNPDSPTGKPTKKKYKYYTPITSKYTYSGASSGKDEKGEPYTIFKYSLDDDDNATITQYNGNVSALTIPETLDGHTVVGIAKEVFKNNTRLKIVNIPNSVTSIGDYAFEGCSNLYSITLSKGLTKLGQRVFANCKSLAAVEIPKNLQKVGFQYSDYTLNKNDGVFVGCTSLKTVRFEEGITLIPAYLFKSCPEIEKIEMPDTVTQIGTAAFAYCEKITDVKLSLALTDIGAGAFFGCTSLETIELPDSVTVIENKAFADCKKLKTIKLSENLTTIGYSALKNCTNLEEIEIPKSLQSAKPQYSGDYTIDKNDGVFAGCTSLKTVRFEEKITLIPAYLFKSCPGIEKIEIPDTVTQIGTAAFAYCEKITDVKLSLALTTMGSGAFAGCSNLKTIELPDSVTVIENRAFSDCKKLESIRLSKKLTTIGYSALKNCTNLEEIEIPKSLKSVKPQYSGDYTIDKNDGVFAGCTSLKTVRFEEGIAIIPDCLFKSCPGIEKIEIPDTVTKIDAAAFAFCDNLQEVSIPDSVEEIGNNVFDSCVSLKEVNLPDTLDSMGTYIFSNCTALTKIHIPKIRQNITEGTFYNCTSLKEINIPQTVIAIRKKAFYNCDSLENMAFSENTKIIEEYAFYDCDALKEVVLPDKLTSLAQYAFYGCDALEKVTIANSLTSMGNNVFDSCKELKEVTLGNGLQTIPANAFSNCGKLTEMVFPYGVTSIAKSAFVNDTSLFNITLPRTVSSIDSTAFSYTDKMTVYGVAGTYAQEWAESVGATFVNKEVNATEITLDRTEITMTKGNSDKLILNITPADCTDAVNWKCTDTSVVTVDSTGNLTAKAVGTATVKVTVGNLSATCKITVVQPVTSISLNKTSVAMDALDTYQLVASPYPNNAFNKEVSWKSSNENVATVDQTGLVTAIAKGSATITVTAMDGSNISKTCSITVRNNANIITVVDELESPHPYANSCSDKWVYTLKDAEKLLVTFSSDTMMEDGFDFLYIYDKDKNQIGKYTGNELAGKTITVPGDTVIIKMSSDDGGTEYGFKVIDVSAAEQERVAMPVADITSQEVAYGTKITLSTDTEGASIYYTVDGSLPTKDSILYTKAIVIEKDMTIKAIALREDYADSAVATYVYTVAMCTVTFDSNGGSPVTEQKIYKGQPLPLLEIPVRDGWHFDGWYWNEQLFDLSQPVNSDMTLVAHWSEFEALGMPSANRKSGTELKKGTRISLTTEEADTTIYYTIDGTEPTINSQIYTAPIVVNEEITIKAFAVKEGYKNSEVATFHYTISEDEDIWGDVDPDDIPEDGIPDGMWVAGVTDVEYTGKPIKPAIRVYDGKTRLTEKKDYTVTYKNNTNAAGRDAVKAPSITVTGKGNYEGKTTITFAILPQDISEDNPLMIADNLTTAYNGRAQKPVPVITFAGKKLTAKKDYVVTCTDTTTGTYKEAGTYDIILNGVGNYTGTRVITYTVTELIPISKVKVSNIKPYTYDWYGSYEYYPEFTLKDGKYTLVENEDYVVTYLNNNQVGTAYLLIEGIGRYTGTRRVPFKINGYSISKGSVWYRGNGKYTYNGEPHTPECYVEVSTGHNSYSTLYENEGFTLQFINNVNAGKATLIFTGINGYSGTLKRTIKIDPFDISADTEDAFHVDLETEVGFCKTGATPKPVITFNGTVLTEGKDYTLKYANNKKVASMGDLKAPTVTITGKGNFKGTRTVTFDIVPQDLSNLTLEAADKVFQNKAKNYTTKFDVLDSNGKKLAVKKDYEIVKYTYADGSEVKDTDIIPAGTNIFVTVKAKEGSGFTGELTGSYRIVQADISKVTAKVMDQTYTGSVITPGKEEITLTMKKVPLTADDYEIVSYSNNVKKGTATVIIRGVGNYGGTKKITFKIKSKKVGFLWW